jgi:sulfite exporter TauE/SafE/copper chaperone CopZ
LAANKTKTAIKTRTIRISGMTCINCQRTIGKKLRATIGVQEAYVSYEAGTAVVTYDANLLSPQDLFSIIESLGYTNKAPINGIKRLAGFLIVILALYFILEYFGLLTILAPSQLAESTMGYGTLFVIGLLTSIHCAAMCGGINLSQSIPRGNETNGNRLSAIRPALLYNAGRVASYTIVGFAAGALGSVFSFTPAIQGLLKIVAGVFMVIMGLNMLGIFPWLRKINPHLPLFLAEGIEKVKNQNTGPLAVGLLNGLMPCGPLQAVQIYALSTGSPVTGGFSMFLFSLGTVPLMLGLGAATGIAGKRFAGPVMTVGAVLVAALGLSMLTQGVSLAGMKTTVPLANTVKISEAPSKTTSAEDGTEEGIQVINSTLSLRGYPAITVQKGVPVQWVIDVPPGSLTGCNNRMLIGEYGIEYAFTTGENIISFTPDRTGTFLYTCWMGMIRSTITVVADTTLPDN